MRLDFNTFFNEFFIKILFQNNGEENNSDESTTILLSFFVF